MRGKFMDTIAPGRVVQPWEKKKKAEQGNNSKKKNNPLLLLVKTE